MVRHTILSFQRGVKRFGDGAPPTSHVIRRCSTCRLHVLICRAARDFAQDEPVDPDRAAFAEPAVHSSLHLDMRGGTLYVTFYEVMDMTCFDHIPL